MTLEQRESVIGRGANALLPVWTISQQKGLQHVHDLNNVAHGKFVGLAVENVESQSCGHSASHGALLPQFAQFPFVFVSDAIPDPPFIQDQSNLSPVAIA